MADYQVIAQPRKSLPTDSWEFAVQTLLLLKTGYEGVSVSSEHFGRTLQEAEEYRIFDRLPNPEHPYGNLDAMLQAEIGASKDEAIEKLRTNGGDRRSKKFQCRKTTLKRGADYLAARIARDRPDILEGMKAGEFRSVHAAAIAAGIVKVPTQLEVVQKAFLKLSKGERRTFLKWAQT